MYVHLISLHQLLNNSKCHLKINHNAQLIMTRVTIIYVIVMSIQLLRMNCLKVSAKNKLITCVKRSRTKKPDQYKYSELGEYVEYNPLNFLHPLVVLFQNRTGCVGNFIKSFSQFYTPHHAYNQLLCMDLTREGQASARIRFLSNGDAGRKRVTSKAY